MRNAAIKLLLCLGICLWVASGGLAGETASPKQEGATFMLCASAVHAMQIQEQPDGAAVVIQLNEKARAEFLDFTTANIGKVIAVVSGEGVLSRLTANTPITSGILWLESADLSGAKGFMRAVQATSSRCGASPSLAAS